MNETLATHLSAVVDCIVDMKSAIISKGGMIISTTPLSAYGNIIRGINTGTDTSDATAQAGDITSGITAYARGIKLVGTRIPGEALHLCTNVNTENGTWDGYRLVRDNTGTAFVYSPTITLGMTYTVMQPEVGSIYTTDATAKIEYVYRPYTFEIDCNPDTSVIEDMDKFVVTL